MNNPEKQDDNALAYAALSLFGNATTGPAPEWHELSAWRAGKLSEERATQILSHVANNPDSFQQWLDLVEAEQWVSEEAAADTLMSRAPSVEQPSETLTRNRATSAGTGKLMQSARHWLTSLFQQPLPVYGGAMAAILLAVLVAPLLQQSELTVQQQLNRSLDSYLAIDVQLPSPPVPRATRRIGGLFDKPSAAEVERQYFQQGLRQSAVALGSETIAQWQSWTAGLSADPVDCSKALDSQHCNDAAEDISALGQWSLLTYAACQPGAGQVVADGNTFWQAQYDLFDQLRTRPAVAQSSLFAPLLDALDEKTPAALCTRMESLMTIGQ